MLRIAAHNIEPLRIQLFAHPARASFFELNIISPFACYGSDAFAEAKTSGCPSDCRGRPRQMGSVILQRKGNDLMEGLFDLRGGGVDQFELKDSFV